VIFARTTEELSTATVNFVDQHRMLNEDIKRSPEISPGGAG